MASILNRALTGGIVAGSLSGIVLYGYTLPGLRRLPTARQRSPGGITTIDDAVRHLQRSGKTGWELVAAAQQLVNARMEYSRRNGWDSVPRAFRRGMGYCQQQATALLLILRRLGVSARPVQALRCRFPPKRIHEYLDPGGISGHMWLVVTIDGVEKDVCPGHPGNAPGKVHFERLSRRTAYPAAMRLLGHIGSMILNARRDNAALRRLRRQTVTAAARAQMARRMRMAYGAWPLRASALLLLILGAAIAARRLRSRRLAEASRRAADHARTLPTGERIRTRIEHEVDTRSIRLAALLLRLSRGRLAHLWRRRALLLTTRGRRSGRERTVPLQFFPDGDDMIVVAANSGLSVPPGWYFNLTANPNARVEVEARVLQVRAEELSPEQALAFWPRVLQIAPDYARYPRRTSRRLPLMRLVPVGPGAPSDAEDAQATR